MDLGSRLPAAGCQSKSTQRTINGVGLWWWLHLVALIGNSSFCLPPLSLGESYSKMPLVPLTAQFMRCHLRCTVCHTTHLLSLASFLSGLRFAYWIHRSLLYLDTTQSRIIVDKHLKRRASVAMTVGIDMNLDTEQIYTEILVRKPKCPPW